MSRRWVVGVDIGGTNLVVGMVPVDGGPPLGLRDRATDPSRGAEAIVDDVVRMVRAAIAEEVAEGDTVLGIGVGSPGPVDRAAGVVSHSPNLGWRNYPLHDALARRIDLPVSVDNDANCATWGEWWRGAGHGAESMFGMIVGTGIGGGYIVNGRLVHGVSDAAGEIGHTTVALEGRLCACGNYGCIEAYASGPNIAARARQGLRAGKTSILTELVEGDLDRITAATVYEAVVLDDAFADLVMNETARILGVGVANVINLLNPEVVVVMGGVTRAGAHLFDPLRAEVRLRAFRVAVESCRIVPAELSDTAGVVGAAGLFLESTGVGDRIPPSVDR